jgi:hypothetical protein
MDLDFVSSLLQALLLAVLPPLAIQLSALAFQAYKDQRASLTLKQQAILDLGIQTAIFAAEQVYKAGKGAEKKQYAIGVAEQWFARYGLKFDLGVVEAQIEAAVYEQLQRDFPPELPE